MTDVQQLARGQGLLNSQAQISHFLWCVDLHGEERSLLFQGVWNRAMDWMTQADCFKFTCTSLTVLSRICTHLESLRYQKIIKSSFKCESPRSARELNKATMILVLSHCLKWANVWEASSAPGGYSENTRGWSWMRMICFFYFILTFFLQTALSCFWQIKFKRDDAVFEFKLTNIVKTFF